MTRIKVPQPISGGLLLSSNALLSAGIVCTLAHQNGKEIGLHKKTWKGSFGGTPKGMLASLWGLYIGNS